jgi:preprotein translocase subunit SecE
VADKVKITAAILLAAAGVAGFYYLAQSPMILRVISVLAGFVAGGLVSETKKVVWPTRKETLQTTGVVFAFVVVMALFLWAVDSSLLWVVKKLLGQS